MLDVAITYPIHQRLRADLDPVSDDLDIPSPEAWRSFSIAMGEFIQGGIHGMWLEPECRDGHCDPQEFVYRIADRHCALVGLFSEGKIKSPIEAMLAGAMLWLDIDWAGFPKAKGFDEPTSDAGRAAHFFVCPQAKICGYSVDFALWFEAGGKRLGLAIECDGHDFHERTKEQASRDKKRDRDLLSAGYPVVRFTGSEIFKDSHSCAEQLRETLSEMLFRVSKDGGLI